MTRQPLTKAERDHLTLLHTAARDPMSTARERATAQAQLADQLVWTGRTDYMNGDLPRLLADLDAAEAERDALRKIAEGCCNATDGGCSPGVSIEFLRDVPSEVEHIKRERDRLRKMPQSAFEAATFRELNAMEAQRDRAEAELDVERKLRVAAEEHAAMEMADLADVERMAWEAFGKPDGTHETSNVQRLCEAFAAMQSAIAHAAAQFDVSDEKRAEDAPISAEVHFREAVRTIARTLPSSTRAVDRGAIWGELREMDRLHADNAKLSADLAETKAKLAALTGVVLRMRNDMGPIVFGEDIDTVEDAIAAARGGAS